MSDYCKNGHLLKEPNLVYNSDGYKECRICRYARNNKWRKEQRDYKRAKRVPQTGSDDVVQ